MQLALFSEPRPVRTPRFLCHRYTPCRGEERGWAVEGEAVDHGGCVNVAVWCLSCGQTGEQSTRKDS
jgi:hypothetical protein